MANLTGGLISGLIFGVVTAGLMLLSVPSAMITKAYAPIIIVGTADGLVIGGILHGWK